METNELKMIFTLLSLKWGRIQEIESNLEHLFHEPWEKVCRQSVFKLYKNNRTSKIIWFVLVSGFHVRMLWKQIDKVSQKVNTALFKKRSISGRSFREFRSSRYDFEAKLISNLIWTLKLFIICNRQLKVFIGKVLLFFGLIRYFYFICS